MPRRSRLITLAGAGVALMVAAACTGPKSNTTPTSTGATGGTGGTGAHGSLNIYLYQEPKGAFSPLAPSNGPDNQVMSLIDQSLVASDPNYQLQPQLASSYPEVSADAKTFTFHLRSGLKWSDGTPFTAQDVLFTYQLLSNPASTSATVGNYTGVTFSAPDANTFVMTSDKPNVGLVAQIGVAYILPKHVLGSLPVAQVASNAYFQHPTVTLGPYKFVDYKPNQYVHVTANPDYSTPVKIKDIYLKPMTSDVATGQLGNGGIDIASFSAADLGTVQGFNNVGIQEAPGAGFVRIALNQTKPYFKDVRVRQAFLYAVDRAQLVSKVLAGKAAVQNSDFFSKNAPSNLNQYPYDPNKAKSLLQQAGWDFGRTVTLEWVAGTRDRDASTTIVQSQLGAIGVKVKLKQVQAADIQSSYKAKSYDMVLYGGGNYATDSWNVNVIVGCAQAYPDGGNIDWFCDKKLDDLMAQANSTTDKAKSKQLYDQAAVEENGQADLMWLYDPMGLWGVNKRVQGFQAAGSQDSAFWNPAGWSLSS